MKKYSFTVKAEAETKEDIFTILREIKESIESGGWSGNSTGDDVYYRYEINKINS